MHQLTIALIIMSLVPVRILKWSLLIAQLSNHSVEVVLVSIIERVSVLTGPEVLIVVLILLEVRLVVWALLMVSRVLVVLV